MRNVARVGVDTAGGGLITGPGIPTVTVNGSPISVFGDSVASHGPYAHAAAWISTVGSMVTVNGLHVVASGDLATCGDPVIAGSTVYVGG